MEVSEAKKKIIQDLLRMLGEDAKEDPALEDTPRRVVEMFEYCVGAKKEPFPRILLEKKDHKGMITLGPIPFTSFCIHHMLPFTGAAYVGYIPDGHIVGLSKIPRIVDHYARRLQLQERLTDQIAEALFKLPGLKPKGVAVVVKAEHSCIRCRGIEKPGIITTTSELRGVYFEQAVRDEFMTLAGLR